MTRSTMRLVSCLAALGVLACGGPAPRPGTPELPTSVATKLDSARWSDGSKVVPPAAYIGSGDPFDSLHAWGMRWGSTRAEIVARLGPPQRRSAAAEKNRHADVMDTVHVLEYGGLMFEVRWSGSNDQDHLTAVNLTEDPGALPGGIRVGSTTRQGVAHILALRPERAIAGDSALDSYLLPSSESPEYVHFYFVRDTLRRIVWNPYVD
jgi:hypothetical protein